jgi:hypothetical protein
VKKNCFWTVVVSVALNFVESRGAAVRLLRAGFTSPSAPTASKRSSSFFCFCPPCARGAVKHLAGLMAQPVRLGADLSTVALSSVVRWGETLPVVSIAGNYSLPLLAAIASGMPLARLVGTRWSAGSSCAPVALFFPSHPSVTGEPPNAHHWGQKATTHQLGRGSFLESIVEGETRSA